MTYSERKIKSDATVKWRTQYAFHFLFRRYSIVSSIFIGRFRVMQQSLWNVYLRQPYAELVAVGRKTIETRTWNTNFRGKFIIHASKTIDKESSNILNRILIAVNQQRTQ